MKSHSENYIEVVPKVPLVPIFVHPRLPVEIHSLLLSYFPSSFSSSKGTLFST
jgi:hypothetical protein